jgi:hypothetical protein
VNWTVPPRPDDEWNIIKALIHRLQEIYMGESEFFKNIFTLGAGIEECLQEHLYMPALVLIYSGLDTLGWLASSEEYASKKSFLDWADNYILELTPLGCTALDLYGARCGILHTLTADSKPTSGKQPRRICYAYRRGDAEKMQRAIDLGKKDEKYVAIHVDKLWEAWRIGIIRFMEELESDPERKARVLKKADKFYINLSPALLDNAVDILERMRQMGVPVEIIAAIEEKAAKK